MEKSGDRVLCDICDEYICSKCCDRDISTDDVIFVVFPSDHKY